MIRTLLQVQVNPSDLPQWVVYALVALELVSIAIGLFIVYTAYRGYRRNRSRPMLFIAVGFLLVLGAPTVLGALILLVPGINVVVMSLLIQVVEVAGFVSILYALRMRP